MDASAMMRTSERWAIVAVIVMTAPAALALPVLAAWRVAIAWNSMQPFNKLVFCSSVASLCAFVPLVFRRRLDLIWLGWTEEFTLFEVLLLVVPVSAVIWSVAPRWESWSGLAFCMLFRFTSKIEEWRDGLNGPKAPLTRRPTSRSRERDEEALTLTSVLRHMKRHLWRRGRTRVLVDHNNARASGRNRRPR